MFVSMNWIKEYVDLDNYNIEDLIRKFTLSTAEVEDIIYKGRDVQNVVVGEIKLIENHPESSKLHVIKVNCGDESYSCVCGAKTVKLGQKVAFAKVGSKTLKGEINRCIIEGCISEGMCCSENELGISDDNSDLMKISSDAVNGTNIKDIYPIEDIIFEVDNKSLTNRPDLWGHYGIAREFAVLTSQKVRKIDVSSIDYCGSDEIDVQIKNEDLVYRYSTLKIGNISVNESPLCLRIRLYYCGMRSINLLADLTNYLMLELGQPMHAFDGSFVNKIVVDTSKESFQFLTLDGIQRNIDTSMLMIYNEYTPIAVAGVMGGIESEIKYNTDSIVLESANFHGISVRKTSSKLGLRTDASIRYEKILDPELTEISIKRFLFLLKQIDPKVKIITKLTDVYVKKYPEIIISFDKKYVDRYTGINISIEQIENTLNLLGFSVKRNGNEFSVIVPSWRATKDVNIKADIIEEITRIYGYDNFEISSTFSMLKPVRTTKEKNEENQIKDILVNKYNLNEVHSYIWCDSKKLKKIGIEVEDNVQILNIALSENGVLRNSLIPTLLTVVYENRSYSSKFGIFEIGRIVNGLTENNLCNERKKLGIVLFDKTISEEELYFNAIYMVKLLIDNIKHKHVTFEKITVESKWQHPKNTAKIMIDTEEIGIINTLNPNNLNKIDKNCSIICIEIDMEIVASVIDGTVLFNEPSKYPVIDYDLSLNINKNISYFHIERSWKDLKLQELIEVKVIDIYESEDVNSITIRLTFSSKDRTLSLEEVQIYIDKIIANLNNQGVYLRK